VRNEEEEDVNEVHVLFWLPATLRYFAFL
jgi:hypothetical protein